MPAAQRVHVARNVGAPRKNPRGPSVHRRKPGARLAANPLDQNASDAASAPLPDSERRHPRIGEISAVVIGTAGDVGAPRQQPSRAEIDSGKPDAFLAADATEVAADEQAIADHSERLHLVVWF